MSHEDYLEAIVMLGGTTDAPVRSVDVANKLGVSKASVNKAISALKEQELVVQPHYGDITLTEAGYAYGRSVLDSPSHALRLSDQGLGDRTRGGGSRGLPDGTRHQRCLLREMGRVRPQSRLVSKGASAPDR